MRHKSNRPTNKLMTECVRKYLQKLQARCIEKNTEEKVYSMWKKEVDNLVANNSALISFTDGVLCIRLFSSAALSHACKSKQLCIDTLNKHLQTCKIINIVFKVY